MQLRFSSFDMAVMVHLLKNWYLKLDEVWGWITPLLPDFHLSAERQVVLDWVANYVTHPPKDLSESWRDGILLCEVADKFSPDLFHGHGILDPRNCFHNVSLALEIIKGSFDIDPEVAPEDIVTCASQAEGKLLNLLLKLKEKVESTKVEDVVSPDETNSVDDESPDPTQDDSFAQGTGLVIGFLGRKASFIVFSNSSPSDPDLVIEIKGPSDTYCCERITKRSPKLKNALLRLGTPRPIIAQCGRSQSYSEVSTVVVDDTAKKHPKMIPLEYEIKDDFVSVAYIPLRTGIHTINIIWHGRYVTGSPFVAMVEDSLDAQGRKNNALLRPPILRKNASETAPGSRKQSVRFKEPATNKVKLGKVRSRRVLRYIVKINKKDVVVEAQSSEMLAPALQKLDFPEDIMLGPRRNSWGFVGDVYSQRRLSLMRQVGIDDSDEDEGRQQRSSSVSVSLPADMADQDTSVSQRQLPKDHILVSSEISASNLNMEKDPVSSECPRLETTSEPSDHFTSHVSKDADNEINISEGEVFHSEQDTSSSDTSNLALLEKYSTEIMLEVNTSDTSGDQETEQRDEQKATPRSITEAKNQNMLHANNSSSGGSESSDSEKGDTEEESSSSLGEQMENGSHENMLFEESDFNQGSNSDHLMEFFDNTETKSGDVIYTPKDAGEHLEKTDAILSDSRNHSSLSAPFDDPAKPKFEQDKHLNVHYEEAVPLTVNQETHAIQKFLTEVNILGDSNQATNDFDYNLETKPHMHRDQAFVLSKGGQTGQLKGDRDMTIEHSKILTRNADIVPDYCDICSFGDARVNQSISYKKIDPEELYVSSAPFNRTNADHQEKTVISHCHIELKAKGQNLLEGAQCENYQEGYHDNVTNMMPPCRESGKEQDSILPFSNDVICDIRSDNVSTQPHFSFAECHDSFSNKQRASLDTENQTKLQHSIGTKECLPPAVEVTKTENAYKCNKTRRMLSHPYLKTTSCRSESFDSREVPPYRSAVKDTRPLNPKKNDEKSNYFPEVRRYSESRFFDSGIGNSTQSQECRSFFKWPASFSNAEKKSVMHSENMRLCLPESNEHSFEEGDKKANEVSESKLVVAESLKFTLGSYMDNHSSGSVEEIVPSNSVKAIVKDFHSKSVEYPAPRSDKTNNIYLRRSFFPPLAANEGRKTVKNRISKWEKFPPESETEELPLEPNKSSVRDKLSLYVNVQSKVAFWESAYHVSEGDEFPKKEEPSVSSDIYTEKDELAAIVSEDGQRKDLAGFDSARDSDNAIPWEPQPFRSSSRPVTSERTEDSGISDDLLVCLKTSDHKRPPVFSTQRSLSDPCLRTCTTRTVDFLSNFEENLNIMQSSLYCSSEENSEESSSETEDGNDEYIDDEIPDYAAMFLGDYISFTGLLGPERSSLTEEAVTQYLQKLEDKSRHIFDPSLSRPHECRALGVGVHYGLVSINNHFQVLTKGAGRGNLSVSIQGSGRHDVTKIIVTYCRNDVYDVIYQVLEPGYYIISVRWSDWSIPGSPFICKVTY